MAFLWGNTRVSGSGIDGMGCVKALESKHVDVLMHITSDAIELLCSIAYM